MLKPREGARLDAGRVEMLYVQLGPSGAEDVVCRAMEELAYRLTYIDRMYCDQNWAEMRKNTRALNAIAVQIGMNGLSRVAGDVISCIDDADVIALAATLSRLIRTGELSLTEIWDLQDLSV
ncbi:hypothetical protein IMCC21224_11524 [Puniceibacterium sp. IMCC21224]|nr:hypothetical protein IMCC21224_11524 [Puniceibacterium sp. IMCC21224]